MSQRVRRDVVQFKLSALTYLAYGYGSYKCINQTYLHASRQTTYPPQQIFRDVYTQYTIKQNLIKLHTSEGMCWKAVDFSFPTHAL